MRILPPLLLALLAGCRGQVADHMMPRAEIIAPVLPRYGLTISDADCLARSLGEKVRPRELRIFYRNAQAVRQGYFERDRLSLRDLQHVASQTHPDVATGMSQAIAECRVTDPVVEARVRAVEAAEAAAAAERAAAARPTVWLNLGAAGSGQAIAVDGSSIARDETTRTGWFRMIDPQTGPSPNAYRLKIHCADRTIEPVAHRRMDENGAVVEEREYLPGEERPAPIEGGTVTEIAYLSLCT